MPRYMPVDHGAFWWVGGLFGLLIVIAVVVGVIFLAREVMNRPTHRQPLPPASTPMTRAIEELDMRYARGELNREEWVQRRSDLLHGPAGPPPPSASTPPPPTPPPT